MELRRGRGSWACTLCHPAPPRPAHQPATACRLRAGWRVGGGGGAAAPPRLERVVNLLLIIIQCRDAFQGAGAARGLGGGAAGRN